MSKKAYCVAFGSFIIGMLLGGGGAYFCSDVYWGKEVAEGLSLVKEMEIAESGQRAFAAYHPETPQIAICALNQYLDRLKEVEAIGGDNHLFMTRTSINFDTMLAHAWLAKIYTAAGQSDLVAQQISEALKRTSQDPKFQVVTNETLLAELVLGMDRQATK